MDIERPDTTPGFEMESPSFTLTFVTGLQRGVASSMLEMETDWYVKPIHVAWIFAHAQVWHDGDHAEQAGRWADKSEAVWGDKIQ